MCVCCAQIQVLIDDSARLQETYPGENAEQIEHLQATVVENWGILQDRAAQRKDELKAAEELHRYALGNMYTSLLICGVFRIDSDKIQGEFVASRK